MQARSEIHFKVGDKAVYPAQGVAEVVNIEEKDIAGNRQRFYVLRILDTDRKIMVPVSNAGAVGLRQVISEQEIREIFDILRERSLRYLFPDISTLEHLEHTVRLVASGRVRLKPTITHQLNGIEQVPKAFEITANKSKYQAINPAQVIIAE